LITDVLDFQKIGLGQIKIEKQDYLLENLSKEAVMECTTFADPKNITINAKVDSVNIYCDYGRILQVLVNVIKNATKFSDENSSVTLHAKSDGSSILFEVIDTGVGIKKEDQGKIFQKFEQLETGFTNSSDTGSGLGLAISKGLVELHGGKIWIESEYGKGTKVSFTTPNRIIFSSKKPT